MKKTSFLIIMILSACFFAYTSSKKNDSKVNPKPLVIKKIVASTSWTAAFADIAGADSVEVIAPANLRHPPEYEVTVSDIHKIRESDLFIYAGFERMMKTLGDTSGCANMLKISCNNSVITVSEESRKIAAVLGTKEECEKRLFEYVNAVSQAKNQLEKKGLKGAKVLCNANQIYLAKDLGFEVVATFGPGPVTSGQIADAKNGNYDFIIDNVHNPQGMPLSQVAPSSKYLVWRNFPEECGRASLLKVVLENIESIYK